MDIRRAAGTNLVAGFFLGVAGFATHAVEQGIDWSVLAAGLAGAIPGGWLGARATGRVPENMLRVALGAVLVARCARVRRAGARQLTLTRPPASSRASHSTSSSAVRGLAT